jgi:putative oxidoreductase
MITPKSYTRVQTKPKAVKIVNDFGLFILRVVAGGYIMKYGLPKLRDIDGAVAKEFESLGFHPASTYVTRAGLVESISGALIALGALGPVGPMMLLADMVVAAVATTAQAKHFDLDKHEEEALFAAIALLLVLNGPGAISIDSAVGIRAFDRAGLRYLSVAGAFAGAAFMLLQRTPAPNS